MATATSVKHTWTIYTNLKAAKPDHKGKIHEWKIQVNEEGTFRCNCPNFIFDGSMGQPKVEGRPKFCKHTKWAEADRNQRVNKTLPSLADQKDEALRIVDEMATAARVVAGQNAALGGLQWLKTRQAMAEVLMLKLASYTPADAFLTVTSESMEGGVRLISFED